MGIKRFIAFSIIYTSAHANSINVELLESKIKEYSQPNSWAYKSIQKDFAFWSNENLSPRALKALIKTKYSDEKKLTCLIYSHNNRLMLYTPRPKKSDQEKILLKSLKILAKTVGLKDFCALFCFHDNWHENDPVLCVTKNKKTRTILIPDWEALKGYSALEKKILNVSQEIPWEKKIDQCFWRGGPTGVGFNLKDYQQNHRCQLVKFSHTHPKIVDARLIQYDNFMPQLTSLLNEQNYFSEPVPQTDSIKYKFLIDIDGHSCCFSRTFWTLLSNSLVFKIKSPNIQWYYMLIKDKESCILINEDFSNLIENFNFYLEHSDEAKQIATHATENMKNHLSHESVLAYLYHVVDTLATKQKF